MDSYATLLFAKITEIRPEAFCKRYGLCRDTALLSGVGSDSTCVFCHHLLDEIMSKLKDPDAEVIALATFTMFPAMSCHPVCLTFWLGCVVCLQFEIIQILVKECNKIEGHVQQVGFLALPLSL
jgi:saposin